MGKVEELARQPDVRGALASFESGLQEIVDLAIEIQQIAAPTFHEQRRAEYVESRFRALGLREVYRDELQNVYGCLAGGMAGDPLVISAHTDTVFDQNTDLTVTRSEERLYGPGIADNSMGVAGLITLARTFCGLEPVRSGARDIWFVANTGEEGLGDLRGMRAVVERFERQGRYIVLEGGLFGYLCHEAIGVRRYRIRVEGPGGHSWGSFGTPSAIHVLGRLIAQISDLQPPADPKTTFNVGVVEGGTTVNSIAREASILLDLRSESPQGLRDIVKQVEGIVQGHARGDDVEVRMEEIGNRPAGRIGKRSRMVRWAAAALKEAGVQKPEYTMASTDANIPLSFGLPAVCIGITRSGHTHRPDEYLEVAPITAGLKQAALLALAASSEE